ncbi:myo-inositol 2-dehydrogenase [Saccharopolyspora erythraea NRRL 2338]|uniref:Inositol 2-dehydrogenase 4 n=2 Tax=Saccharopolyspora erythraea TaxID=1836 RepID=IOLG4_SACEN|nr:Gfo/Idh/MocA family oxidoreductase [Saccharopolyspora erythraea]A4FK61.1 RecName: Full=Inositol 2-dehydrogenase 4; AltName: Full=Myo-inositol 2-dehydrogenase 4; Short=MI 2-dehydrogenase 4 [Saccharopolyspora erythraea NRRL 2338]EQD87006.1 inositol 2-dehydrogenase [Saccharopolyspora erythraea D]PFG98075.1 myo-inositol 2-dehydrogenase [Saccharopolyspora erythraea NRRL 2338]QRK88186.1 Gfo/Idh/MocA family oxidoreductase [Saccharopolyspora erythraea]CAM04436.1 putative oxidoreductase myo-inositol
MSNRELRVGLVGAGLMGSDHATRIHRRISGASLVAVGDPDLERAERAAAGIEGCQVETDPLKVIEASDVDAVVLATPGRTHEPLLLAAIERGIPVLCEKPLTPDSKSSLRVVEAEVAAGRRLVQVGFMRRFDPEYAELKRTLHAGALGRPLLMHCAHRNASAPPGFTSQMMIFDSVVHEFDTTRWLLGEEITAVSVRHPRSTANAPSGMTDPQLVTIETASGVLVTVEIFVNCGFGYQVRCEAVCEGGTAQVGGDSGMTTHVRGAWGGSVAPDFRPRFQQAFDEELQRWADAARAGGIDGASAWDGCAAAAACEAGVAAQTSGARTPVQLVERPGLYA